MFEQGGSGSLFLGVEVSHPEMLGLTDFVQILYRKICGQSFGKGGIGDIG
jgi:hypothetical protein